MKTNKLVLILSIASALCLTGYSIISPVSDAKSGISKIKDQEKNYRVSEKELGEKPKLEPYKPYHYEAGDADPFKMQAFVLNANIEAEEVASSTEAGKKLTCDTADCSDEPPQEHIPYFLEDYDLESLNMVGTVKNASQVQAVLIKTPDAGVMEARVGEFIGRNNGQVISIHQDHIVIREKYKVPRGWQNRTTTLELFN
ncbi:MAG: pilus assembly protein PilP [Cardiobacteriaceae bacterium]|nr:pilus assembly protein PilP [Cardiobacteriaceae bacterium]